MKSRFSSTSLTRKKSAGGVLDTVKTVVYAVLIALAVRTVAYEPFNIPSGSMVPTLLVGDYLFVSKFSYGYSRYSLPFGLPLFSGRILFHPPERGDVVVLKLPTDNSTDNIKRAETCSSTISWSRANAFRIICTRRGAGSSCRSRNMSRPCQTGGSI